MKKFVLFFLLLSLGMSAKTQTITTWIDSIRSCPGGNFIVPIKVKNFTNVAALQLIWNYPTTSMTYLGYQNVNPALNSMLINNIGAITIALGQISLPDSATLFELKFHHNQDTVMHFTWDTIASLYGNLNGDPLPSVFKPGYISSTTLKGYVRYYINNMPIGNCKVYLKQSGIKIDSAISQVGTGYYQFNCTPNGNYTIEILKTNNWGGVNAIDALNIAKFSVGIATTPNMINDPFLRLAGDVNNSGFLNASDSYSILKRFSTAINYFSSSDWITNGAITVTITNKIISKNITVLCAGDVNASYLPPSN